MLAVERHRRIVAAVNAGNIVRVGELAARLDVSEMTIRRDIESLHAQGALRKVHGGATSLGALSAVEPGFAQNTDRRSGAKQAIAARAAELIAPGMTIAITGGTTTYRLAGELPTEGGLTVITNSLPTAEALHRLQSSGAAPGLNVLLTGGERTPSEALVGPLANASIARVNVDICFMGAHGLDLTAGVTTPNLAEAETNRIFASQCARLTVLADHSKFDVVSLAGIADLDEVTSVVTDDGPIPRPELYEGRVHLLRAAEKDLP